MNDRSVRGLSPRLPCPGSGFGVKRTGLVSLLLGIFRPRDAGAASVGVDRVTLAIGSRWSEISLREIDLVEVKAGLFWAKVGFRHAGNTATVSGLSRREAGSLAAEVERARVDWWRCALASHAETLRAIHKRLSILADPDGYVRVDVFDRLLHDAKGVVGHLGVHWPKFLSDAPEIRMLRDIREFLKAPDNARSKANQKFVANEQVRSRDLFDRIEIRPLTDEQRRAVVVDEMRNLLVASAGSGKTSVIVAKAGWLVKRGFRKPSELLLLAFARDARNEMEERIRARLGPEFARDMKVRTFHSLGMAIIGEVEGKRPMLARTAESDRALFDLLREIISDLLATDGILSKNIVEWFQDRFAPYRSVHEFTCWGAYWNYIRQNEILSLNGDVVKSYEECEIANFLFLNGIAYEYEAPYEYATATAERRQYRPDFHLRDHGIYIEHFGIDAAGNTAPFVDREKYLLEMKWKRQVHIERGTVLVETFSHERASGRLLGNLKKKLLACGVALAPLPRERMFAVLEKRGRVDPFTRLMATFLQHFRGSGLSLNAVTERASALPDRGRAMAFLAVFRSVYDRYRETLSRAGEIDFHDMIDRARKHVEAGRYHGSFGYILVDEFQDISPARAGLLKALLDCSPGSQLFAVGDDWQAIYRFGGSDIAVMRDFGDWFGAFERVDLETTFRCSDRIAAVAANFILRNPAQIRKAVRAGSKADGPAVHVGLPGDDGFPLLKEALDRIVADAARYEGVSKVLLLGRYRHLRPSNLGGLARRYPSLRLSYMTVHRAKGLEADYAVVLGLCAGRYGFPVEIADDPLLDLVMSASEAHPNAEERRLLYVALTRARRQAYLLAEGGPPSAFVTELLNDGYDIQEFGRPRESDVPCPRCGEGCLERRENARDGGIFYGCSNWPLCDYTGRPCPLCDTGLPILAGETFRCRECGGLIKACPACGGWLETRMGRFGRFLGCSNFPDCGYTRNPVQSEAKPKVSADTALARHASSTMPETTVVSGAKR